MNQIAENLLIDDTFKRFFFIETDDKHGVYIVDHATRLPADCFAFLPKQVHPTFLNLLLAAPMLYQELSRCMTTLEKLADDLEFIGADPNYVARVRGCAKSSAFHLSLAREGAEKYTETYNSHKLDVRHGH